MNEKAKKAFENYILNHKNEHNNSFNELCEEALEIFLEELSIQLFNNFYTKLYGSEKFDEFIIESILIYILSQYPKNLSFRLSPRRLTMLIYLIDWQSCLEKGSQMTNIEWVFDNYGVNTPDIDKEIRKSEFIEVRKERNELIGYNFESCYIKEDYTPRMRESNAKIIDKIIRKSSRMFFNELIKQTEATAPMQNKMRFESLDLIAEAEKINKIKKGS